MTTTSTPQSVTQEFLDQRLKAIAQQVTVELDKRFAESEARLATRLEARIDRWFAEMEDAITKEKREPGRVHLLFDD